MSRPLAHHHAQQLFSHRCRPFSSSPITCRKLASPSVSPTGSVATCANPGLPSLTASSSHCSLSQQRLPRRCSLIRSAADGALSDSSGPLNSPDPVPAGGVTVPAEPGSTGWVAQGGHYGDLKAIIASIPYRKLLIWAAVAFIGLQLQDFFGIIMGTYIIAFLGNAFVEWTMTWRPVSIPLLTAPNWRHLMVYIYFGAIVSLVVGFGVLTIPDIAREGAVFVNRLQSDNVWVVLVEKMRHGLGDGIMESVEKTVYLATSNDITAAAADLQMGAWRVADVNGMWTEKRSVQLGTAIASMLKGYTTTAAKIIGFLLSSVTRFAVQIVVSLVLAFMFVWDAPVISAGIMTLKNSRLAPIYNEVAPVLTVFGKLFGRAMEAQARIALVNTLLTGLGLLILDIPGVGLLSFFVFLCSFIPIAGVAISTIPIGFVALTEYGFFKLLLAIVMVALVHFVEAYMLNPAIYSAHLKLHPLVVLSVLVFAEHSLGVWGLLLAVPLTVFMLDYCIRYPDSSVTEVGKKELEKVLQSIDEK